MDFIIMYKYFFTNWDKCAIPMKDVNIGGTGHVVYQKSQCFCKSKTLLKQTKKAIKKKHGPNKYIFLRHWQ